VDVLLFPLFGFKLEYGWVAVKDVGLFVVVFTVVSVDIWEVSVVVVGCTGLSNTSTYVFRSSPFVTTTGTIVGFLVN
jgi:hypothetical protein